MNITTDYRGPLAGLNVIDFGHYYAGPMAGILLADQGANVIRIVKPGEKELPEQQYRLLNRNKKLLELDLKTPAGNEHALSLIERADVVIENFRPGVMKRLGLDYASVKTLNPGLVYLSLPGFASTDKERANIQAWEGILGAAAGLYTEAAYARQELNFPPVYTSVPLCSAYGSTHGAIAVMAALIAREQQGIGAVIEVPLVDAGLASCTDSFIFKRGAKGKGFSPTALRAVAEVDNKIPEALKPFEYSPGDSPQVLLEKLSSVFKLPQASFIKSYESADNRLMLMFPVKPWLVERFFRVLGLEEQLKREGFVNEGAWKRIDFGNNLSSNFGALGSLSFERAQRVVQLLTDVFKSKTALEWEEIMAEAGVPFALVRTRDEWLALKPLLDSGVLTQMDNGQSVLTVPGRTVDMSGPGGVVNEFFPKEPEPVSMDQIDKLLEQDISRISEHAWQPQKKGDLLKGLKVLDMCSIVAGPTSAYALAQYGAEVIRAEPPQSFNLPMHLPYTLEVNQGKRSIVVDIKTEPGRQVFQRLVRWADVVLHNRADDIAKRLGVAHDQLQQINPDVISCQFTALGGTWRGRGGWENRLGFDPMANFPSGLVANYGTLENPMAFGGVSADTMGGYSLAFSSLLGVYQQRKTGFAGEGRSSLARATNHNQFPWMIAENGNSDWGEARGQLAVGQSWWQRMYACTDGWIYVGTSDDRAKVLAETVTEQQEVSEQQLEASFADQDCAYWLAKLSSANIACHRVLTMNDICSDTHIRCVTNEPADATISGALAILRWDAHPCGKPVILPAPTWARVGEAQTYKRLTPTPKVGEHTREVLTELGYTEDEIVEFIRLKVAYEYLPAIGNKETYFFEQERR